jgi:hypothetical protein
MSLNYNIDWNKCWGWKLYATMVWMHSETSSHSGQWNDHCMHGWSSGELKCTEEYMVTRRFIRWGFQARLTMTVNCNLRRCLFVTRTFKSRFLRTSLKMEISFRNLFSDTSFGGPNIHLVRIELSQHSEHWELRPLWVSVVHGWVEVAGHLVESLSRICLLRFSPSSCCSFDRARWCKSYFRIWKQRSKHTTRQYRVMWGW